MRSIERRAATWAAALSFSLMSIAAAQDCPQAWSALESGTAGGLTYPAVLSLHVFDADGRGPNAALLHAGGNFTHAGGMLVNSIATWDGKSWSPLVPDSGPVGVGNGQVVTSVYAMASFDDDHDPRTPAAMYVGGDFLTAGSVSVNHVARWNGLEWSALDDGVNWGIFASNVRAFAVFDDDGEGPGLPALHVAGSFTHAGDVEVNHIARWDGKVWTDVGGGASEPIHALAVFDDDGDGPNAPALYATGNFTSIGGNGGSGAGSISASFIAGWDGTQWAALTSGLNGSGKALHVFDDGDGEDLYVGGVFTMAGGLAANRIARWSGAEWSALGTGLGSSLPFPIVEAITQFDDGRGNDLYVTGQFQSAGGMPASNVARWDGAAWSSLDSGIGAGDSIASGYSIAPFDSDLYLGGNFTVASGVFANYIARWNGCPPSCAADLAPVDAPDGDVGPPDLAELLSQWGACPPPKEPCPADIAPTSGGDGVVGAADLAELLANWGPC
jgi:hypothetical protein